MLGGLPIIWNLSFNNFTTSSQLLWNSRKNFKIRSRKNENFSKSNVNKKLEHFNIDKSNLSINSQNLRRYTPDLVSDEDIIPELNYKYNK